MENPNPDENKNEKEMPLSEGLQELANMPSFEKHMEFDGGHLNFGVYDGHRNVGAYDPSQYGWDENGINRETGMKYDRYGYDIEGYGKDGFSKEGVDRNEWDENGINKNTGTPYDEDGYGKDGFDEDGVDREGFDRRGFGTDGRDREGYDKYGKDAEGFNRKGWNDDGVNKKTGTRYDERGLNVLGRDRYGINEKGFDLFGRDREGFDEKGWNAEGINKETGTKYDKDGFDMFDIDSGGYDRRSGRDRNGINRAGFNLKGWNAEGINEKTGTKYDKKGFDINGRDSEGFNKKGWNEEGINKETGTKYDKDNFDVNGRDPEGFNRFGRDKEGYDREGKDRDGFTREFNSKYNKYDLDENGYDREGNLDGDVEFALEFINSGINNKPEYAVEKNIPVEEINEKIKNARKKCEKIDEMLGEIFTNGNRQRAAIIRGDTEKYLDGKISFSEYWEKHPQLNINNVYDSFTENEKKGDLCLRTLESIVMDSKHIDENISVFSGMRYDVNGAISGMESFKKKYGAIKSDDESVMKRKREGFDKINKLQSYLKSYKDLNYKKLVGERRSFDGGQTWIEFTEDVINEAVKDMKENKKFISVRSVADYIIDKNK